MPGTMTKIGVYIGPSARLAVQDRLKTTAAKLALLRFEEYLNGLITEWDRIADTTNVLWAAQQGLWDGTFSVADAAFRKDQTRKTHLTRLDLHFYTICWDKLQKFAELLEAEQDDPAISLVLSRVKPLLERSARARDYFEHYDNRVKRRGIGTEGYVVGSPDALSFRYEDKPAHRKPIERTVTLGRAEVLEMVKVYEAILAQLAAGAVDSRS